MTNIKNDEKVQILRESLQSLFQTETRALIAWNLIVYKELTVILTLNTTQQFFCGFFN